MPICAKATASASRRTVMRLMSGASAMVAPPVQDLAGAFQTTVVSEASTSLAAFSRTVPAPSGQRPPSAPLTSQCARAISLAWVQPAAKAKPFCASNSRPRAVADRGPTVRRPLLSGLLDVGAGAWFRQWRRQPLRFGAHPFPER